LIDSQTRLKWGFGMSARDCKTKERF